MQDYIKGSNRNRTNTQPREVRSQDAESVQEESGANRGQDDGHGAEEVGSQEPPDFRPSHGVRAAATCKTPSPAPSPTHGSSAAGQHLPQPRGAGQSPERRPGAKVRILGQEKIAR